MSKELKIKDELLNTDWVIVKYDSKKQRNTLLEWLEINTDLVWFGGGYAPLEFSPHVPEVGFLYMNFKERDLSFGNNEESIQNSVKKEGMTLCNYNEIWE